MLVILYRGFRNKCKSKDETNLFVNNGEKVAVKWIGYILLKIRIWIFVGIKICNSCTVYEMKFDSVLDLRKWFMLFFWKMVSLSLIMNLIQLIVSYVMVYTDYVYNWLILLLFMLIKIKILKPTCELWHKHLWHISQESIDRFIKDDILPPLTEDLKNCIEFVKGKKVKTKRKVQHETKSCVIIHTDICNLLPIHIQLKINISFLS